MWDLLVLLIVSTKGGYFGFTPVCAVSVPVPVPVVTQFLVTSLPVAILIEIFRNFGGR